MITTFKVLSLLLSYPTREIAAGAPELREALAKEDLLTTKARTSLEPLLCSFEEEDIYDLQEQFVFLFDRTKTLSLHLFEHVHGESRDRGQRKGGETGAVAESHGAQDSKLHSTA